jgi:serine protease Do
LITITRETARYVITRLSAVIILLLLACPSWAASDTQPLHPSEGMLIRNLLPTVVNISSQKVVHESGSGIIAASPSRSAHIVAQSGSGFILDASGIIVTNWHVVESAYEITVTFEDNSRAPATVISAARSMDIALLKVQPPHPLATVQFGDSDKLQVGDPVLAVGNPLGIGMSVSAGIVSALNRDILDTPYDHFIQTDAAINHGNSGGPLFNMQGDVIGLNTALYSPTSGSVGLGFAIPSNDVRFVVDRLRRFGWMRPGWIGVKIQQMTPEMASALGLEQPEGSIVAAVLSDGPAGKAGIRVGDVLLRFADKTPGDERALLRDIVETSPGQQVTITLLRDGKEVGLPVVVGEWPRTQGEDADGPLMAEKPHRTIPPDLGLSLATLTSDSRAKSGLPLDQPGVLIAGVAANTDAAEHGLVAGDVILKVHDSIVSSPGEVRQKLEEARAAKRDFVLMLVLPKAPPRTMPKWAASKWVALRVASD